MGIREIVKLGDPSLRKAVPADWRSRTSGGQVLEAVEDAVATLRSANGVGIAAPQIGVAARMIVLEVRPGNRYGVFELLDLLVLLDPEISTVGSTTAVTWEGCLSLPELRGPVRRPQEITLKGNGPDGVKIERHLSGFAAVVAQHEVDHLDGVLFIDRMESLEMLSFEDQFRCFHAAEGSASATQRTGAGR